jgi:lipopolysaccharide/colanic/teichoic acid biosynthesis glycosyltransferase
MAQEIDLKYLCKQPTELEGTQRNRASYYFFKRIFDILISIIALVLSLPLMVVTAILIKLDSPGPVFFVQKRIGARRIVHNNRNYWITEIFSCYKFRTMIHNADASLHQAYVKALIDNDQKSMQEIQSCETKARKLVADPRITRLGRILRSSSIDEIPQFWNVLKGEMSVVGPRPPIPYEVEMYKPWHRRRLKAKPGITGLWQVTARSSADFDEMVNLDIKYIESQSLLTDLKIVLMTPFVIISHKGAV